VIQSLSHVRDKVDYMETNEHILAYNINLLIKLRKLSITQTANDLNLPIMTVRRLISGETANPHLSTLKTIAEYFDISIDQLVSSQNILQAEDWHTKSRLVPILSWQEVRSVTTIQDLNLKDWKNWQSVPADKEKDMNNAFALKTRPSFFAQFPSGTVFIIDPDSKVCDGDIVLVKITENNDVTLRKVYIDPPETILHSLIPDLSPITYDSNKHKIIGVNVLTMHYNKNHYQLRE